MNRRVRKEKNILLNNPAPRKIPPEFQKQVDDLTREAASAQRAFAQLKSTGDQRTLDVEKLNRKFINMIVPGAAQLIPDHWTVQDVINAGGI